MLIKDYIIHITACVLGIIIGIILLSVLPAVEDMMARVMLIIFGLICSISGINGLIWVGCSIHENEQRKKEDTIRVIKHNDCFLLINTITWRCIKQFDNLLDAKNYANKLNQLK